MRKKISWLLCLCLLMSALLGACNPATPSEPTQQVTESTSKDAPTETNLQTEISSETEQETHVETEAPVEIVNPEGERPSLEMLLPGESFKLLEDWHFENVSLGSLKTNGSFVSTGGSLFKTSPEGLTTVNTGWDALGFAAPVSTDIYTIETTFYVHENNRGGNNNAAMVGLFCKSAANLFIDGGLWFAFREHQVSAYVKQGFDTVITKDLPFSAADGIRFKAVGNRESVTVYANDVLIATALLSDNSLELHNANGDEIARTDLTHLSVSDGYTRYMAHYANATLSSMKVSGETVHSYAPADTVFAFQNHTPYVFMDKIQVLSQVPVTPYSDLCYADAETLGKLFGFSCETEHDTLTMVRDGATLVFTADKAEVNLNGERYSFPTAVKKQDAFMLSVKDFGQMLGYSASTFGELTLLATKNNLMEENLHMSQERFDLYRDVVYNYDDVECDQTGVGRLEPVPYEERLVGIAYTTWHRPATQWGGSATWDIPLIGPYCSDNEEVIRQHGEWLRDAGVDFVFVDWSNNTEYVPETMREQRADFRMIEEATDKLFDIWATIEGAPKICIFVGPGHNGPKTIENGAHQKKVDQVWEDYINNPDRADMYFHYDGKPLLICYGATPNQYTAKPQNLWDDDRFTVRWMTGYVGQQGQLFRPGNLQSTGFWSWEERGAQTYTIHHNRVEAVTVSASTRSQGKNGTTGYIPEAGRQNGATLKKQFQRACDLGAGIVILVSWNEWTTGEQPSAEVSKDLEPSVIHGTFYYDLMREQIKKFKGLVQK